MLAAAFLLMAPESLEKGAHTYVLIAYFTVHVFEHTLTPHFDGVAIASGFLVSRPLGFVLFGAVLLHKLPEGFAVGSLRLASGGSRPTVLLASALLGLATIVGVLSMAAFTSVVGLLLYYIADSAPEAAGIDVH